MNFAAIFFEVMDKEWPVWFVLVAFLCVGVVGLFLCKRKPLFTILFLAWALYGAIRQVVELNDPYVGPVIRTEGGITYVLLSYFSVGGALILPLVGAWLGRVHGKAKSTSHPA
jgi:hypothetical protein